MARYEKLEIALLGIVAASTSFIYGLYALAQAHCIVVGRGNPPYGTFINFYGMEARLLSTIYIGLGVLLCSHFVSRQVFTPPEKQKFSLAWHHYFAFWFFLLGGYSMFSIYPTTNITSDCDSKSPLIINDDLSQYLASAS